MSKQRCEEDRAREVERRLLETRALAPLAGEKPELVREPVANLWPKRRALLIINSKSGPDQSSVTRVREVVDLLAAFCIRADVRVKLRKSQARREARAASKKKKYDFVIAAGGDGTVEAVASGMVGGRATLGIIPLGTFNNVATSLGVPSDVPQAVALIACGPVRRIDVGVLIAKHMKRPKVFLEVGTVGLGAVAGTLGQHIEKGRWDEAAQTIPGVTELSATPTRVRLDDSTERVISSLLITVSNTPRAGAGLNLAPSALMDDGLLDLCVYAQQDPTALVTQLLPGLLMGSAEAGRDGAWQARARRVDVRTEKPMPVSIESKLVGTTPACFTVVPGAISVVVGDSTALAEPGAPALVQASRTAASGRVPPSTQAVVSVPEPVFSVNTRALEVVVPVAGRTVTALSSARSLALPAATAVLGAAAWSLLGRRNRKRR